MSTATQNTDLFTGCGICGAEFCTHGVCRVCGSCAACEGRPAPTNSPSPAAEAERLRQKAEARRQALDELEARVCPCGNRKTPKQSFCRWCYVSLPAEIKAGLYQSFATGYLAWWTKAKQQLRASGRLAPEKKVSR